MLNLQAMLKVMARRLQMPLTQIMPRRRILTNIVVGKLRTKPVIIQAALTVTPRWLTVRPTMHAWTAR